MDFLLMPVNKEDMDDFKRDMQEAFQQGAMKEYSDLDVEILTEKEIEKTLDKKGAVAYKAVVDGKMLGGAIVTIDEITRA